MVLLGGYPLVSYKTKDHNFPKTVAPERTIPDE